jgi:cbb3-type cytochrome oxidase subunit 3
MKQEALKYFTDTHLTAIALLIFFSFFVGMLVYVVKKSKQDWDEIARLPLEENVHEQR